MKYSAKMYTASGGAAAAEASVVKTDGAEVIVVDAVSPEPLAPGCAVSVNITPDGFGSAVALYRHSEYWCRPVFCGDVSGVPDETQLLLIKNGGRITVILPAVSEFYRATLCSEEGNLTLKMFSLFGGLCACSAPAAVVAEGENPFLLIEKCFETAIAATKKDIKLRKDRVYPQVLEYLGWCSWDAMQIRVNESGLLEKLREFRDKKIPVRWALIDDMWADVPDFRVKKYSTRQEMFGVMHGSRLASFEAAPDRFPDGLKAAIGKMKNYVDYVGVWHPVTGYWFGVDKDSALYEKYASDLMPTADGRYIPKPEYGSFYRFFDGFHEYLRECGADFVKVDNQSIIRMFYAGCAPIGVIASDMHKAIDESVGRHFGGAVINCMGCASDNVFSRPESAVTRCSDDFIPEDSAWFTKHILQCSFTSMYQSPLYWSDWDMWWSDDGQAVKNSVLRAISGGPVYVSDEIGRSRAGILAPLTLSDGRILRCARPAAPSADCLFADPVTSGGIFKVQNVMKGGGAVAAFNLGEGTAKGVVRASDVPELEPGRYAVYEHFTSFATVVDFNDGIETELPDKNAFALYIFVPVKNEFAAVGITEKFMSPLTVVSADRENACLSADGTYLYYKDGKFYEEKRRSNINE